MPSTLADLAARYGGVVDARARSMRIQRVAPLATADASALAPVTSRRFAEAARTTTAALLVDRALEPIVPEGRRWTHADAAWALARLLEDSAPAPTPRRRRHPTAVIERGARIDRTALIGPGAVVFAGAVIGPGCSIGPNAVVYGAVELGARVVVGAGAVIGAPGFGWATDPDGRASRIPQLGGVRIEDDVAIGPLCTIDAGTLAPTVVGRGTKLDAHVHVGHNAVIGPGVLVAAQAGFGGSARIGAGVLVGGQAGITDHATVGDGARLAAKAGVIGNVAPGATVAGYPAVDRARWLRATAWALDAARTRRKAR